MRRGQPAVHDVDPGELEDQVRQVGDADLRQRVAELPGPVVRRIALDVVRRDQDLTRAGVDDVADADDAAADGQRRDLDPHGDAAVGRDDERGDAARVDDHVGAEVDRGLRGQVAAVLAPTTRR